MAGALLGWRAALVGGLSSRLRLALLEASGFRRRRVQYSTAAVTSQQDMAWNGMAPRALRQVWL